jgi:cell division protein ZapA (FtsZ GTPase activity inhibitor)
VSNRVKIQICGITLHITTGESPDYVREIATLLDEQVSALINSQSRVSLSDALALVAVNYADAYKKSNRTCDHLRSQIAEYLEDAARTRIELDEARREIERLRRALAVQGDAARP